MLPTPPPSPKPSDPGCPDPRIGHVIAERIELTRVLGVGAYGTVYQAQDVFTGACYAVKALNKNGLDARQRKFQKREVELQYHASRHENVLSIYNIIDSPDCTFVVLEFCQEGDLFAKITEEGHYVGQDDKARRVFLQLLRAVQFCHSKNIFHRDLKPENILVKDGGSTIKLADFGLATRDQFSNDFGCGSTFYMSPECQESNPRQNSWYRSAPNDVWALGVVLVNLTCGRNPWKRATVEDSTFRAFRKDPDFLKSILPISEELNFILQRIFEIDPQKRITISELIEFMECSPRLTQAPEEAFLPPTPPYSPTETVIVDEDLFCDMLDTPVDSPMACDSPMSDVAEQVPVLHLPSPRYPIFNKAAPFGSLATDQSTHVSTPPRSIPGSPQAYSYTTQARSQVFTVPGHLLYHQQPYNAWTNCGVYANQPYLYAHYGPAWPCAY